MPFLRIFLSMIFVVGFALPAFCGVGNVDNRTLVNDEEWATQAPFNRYVRFKNGTGGYCTAQYVAPNIILTAAHCIKGNKYLAAKSDGKYFELELLNKGAWSPSGTCDNEIDDWAALLVKSPANYSSQAYFDYTVPPNSKTHVISAGFGALRILRPSEIAAIKKAISSLPRSALSDPSTFIAKLDELLAAQNIPALYEREDSFKQMRCDIQPKNSSATLLLSKTCDIWGGNSGGAVTTTDGKTIYGIAHCATQVGLDAFNDRNDASFVSVKQFQNKLKRLISENPPKKLSVPSQLAPSLSPNQNHQSEENSPGNIRPITPQNLQNLNNINLNNVRRAPDSPASTEKPGEEDLIVTLEAIRATEVELSNQDQAILPLLPRIDEIWNQGLFVNFLAQVADYQETADRLEELKKKYQEAKEREQSDANRALTALTTAATGLGTMAAFSAYSEQKADEEAEADMRQYITTMKCEYGGGEQVNLGDEQTLPGGNELFEYYTEYKTLADNLKTTKAALGLRAGIESEVLYDRAQSGLYQYASTGKTGGGETSLFRALTDSESEDATAWSEQKETASKKLKVGGGVAAGGAAVGVIGNAAINTDMIQNIKDAFKK